MGFTPPRTPPQIPGAEPDEPQRFEIFSQRGDDDDSFNDAQHFSLEDRLAAVEKVLNQHSTLNAMYQKTFDDLTSKTGGLEARLDHLLGDALFHKLASLSEKIKEQSDDITATNENLVSINNTWAENHGRF